MTDASQDSRWWSPEFKDERHKRILNVVRAIRRRQVHWHRRDLLHACLYGNMPILGFGPSSHASVNDVGDDRLQFNLIKPKCDTWVSMMCRSRPEPMFLPTGADPAEAWTLRKRAKGLERWADGLLESAKFHDTIAPLAVLEVAIFDFGVAKVMIDGVDDAKDDWSEAEVCIEHAHSWQMVIDDLEALAGKPRSLHQRQWVDRFVLIERFPKMKDAILTCPQRVAEEDEWGEWGMNESCDQILVTESWHLPSGKRAKDGRRAMVIETATLLDEEYTDDRFPFAFLRQMPAPWGVRGIPITAQLRPLQLYLNTRLEDAQDSQGIFSRPKWLSPRQGNIEKAHMDDDIGTIIEYDAPYKPEAYVPTGLNPSDVNFIFQVEEYADKLIGISAMKSGGLVPTQLKSGKAIEETNDTQDGRFLVSSRLFETWCMELVELAIDKARTIAKHRKDYATRYSHGTYVQMVPFKDVDMKRDQYMLKCYPASALANTPGARYDQLQDMFDRGLIDMPTFRHLLGFPDLEGEMRLLNAPYELADKLIERYLDADDPDDPDVYMAPEPSWPLQVLYERFLYAAVHAVEDGCPDANIALLRRFSSQVEDQAKKIGLQLPGMAAPGMAAGANLAAPTPGGPPPMAPPGAAMPPGGPPSGAPMAPAA